MPEYTSSVRDLLGVDVLADVESVGALSGFTNIGASRLTVSRQGIEQFETAALDVAARAFAASERRQTLVGCTPTNAGDPCIRSFLSRLALRASRRPVTDDELLPYSSIVTTVAAKSDVWTGLQYAVAGLLQSPNFLYRVELGEPDPNKPGRTRYTAYEMAARLSFFVWDTTPDETLLRAAASGDTLTDAGITRMLDYLLASERARASVKRFFREYLDLDRLDNLSKDQALFPTMSATLASAMREEIERATSAWVFDDTLTLAGLLDARTTFVNAELAELYGLTAASGSGFVKASLPSDGERQGLLGFAGFLAIKARGTRTSPTLRGRFVREHLLCQQVAPPPANAEGMFDAPGFGEGLTLRERLEQHRANPACAGCHALMDPLGFPLEHFDGLGKLRREDGGKALDTTGDIDGKDFDGLSGLVATLRADPRVSECLARHLFRHATGRMEGEEDAQAFKAQDSASALAPTLLEAMRAIALSDSFRYASAP